MIVRVVRASFGSFGSARCDHAWFDESLPFPLLYSARVQRADCHRAAAVHRWTIHRGTGQRRPRRVPGELRRLSRRGSDGLSATGGSRLRRQLGNAHDTRSLRADPDDDADRQARCAARRHLREHRRVHPAVEWPHAGHPAADGRDVGGHWRDRAASCGGTCTSPGRTSASAGRTRGRTCRSRRCRRRARSTAGARHRTHRRGRSEELRADHRRDASQSPAGRLADDPPRFLRIELQPAQSDHARQRTGSAAGVGVADGRGRHQSAGAARAQRDDLHQQHRRDHSGDRRQDRRPDLGAASRQQHRVARYLVVRRQAVSSR